MSKKKNTLPIQKLSILHYLPILTISSVLTHITNGDAVTWNKEKGCFIPQSFKKWRIFTTYVLVTSYVTFASVQFLLVIMKTSWLQHIPSAFLLNCIVGSWALGSNLFFHGEEIASFLNSMVYSERKYLAIMVAEKEEQEHQETGDRKFFVRVYKI
jgi:hypothetical protein